MLDYFQLEALLAVQETGTFEGAARHLNLSSFAVVQRIKTLEARLGVTLVERAPTRATRAGEVLCEHIRAVRTLEEGLMNTYRGQSAEAGESTTMLKVAINDENLADWIGTLTNNADISADKFRLDIRLIARNSAATQMRAGDLSAALTFDGQPVYGFKVYTVAKLEYLAVATPAFIARYFPEGVTPDNITDAPALRFCRNDDLIYDWMEKSIGKVVRIPQSRRPSVVGSLQGCLDGGYWSMQPRQLVQNHMASGTLTEIVPDTPIHKTLYWHVMGNMVETVLPITRSLKHRASELF